MSWHSAGYLFLLCDLLRSSGIVVLLSSGTKTVCSYRWFVVELEWSSHWRPSRRYIISNLILINLVSPHLYDDDLQVKIFCLIYRLKNFHPAKIMTNLFHNFFSLISYDDVYYFDLNAGLLNNHIRFIFNLRKYDNVSALRYKLQ